MPQFNTLTSEKIQELSKRGGGAGSVDLTEYKDAVKDAAMKAQGWGEVMLAPSDNVRAIKRRTTIAAKELGYVLKWNKKSTPSQLLYHAVDPASVVKRPRKAKAEAGQPTSTQKESAQPVAEQKEADQPKAEAPTSETTKGGKKNKAT